MRKIFFLLFGFLVCCKAYASNFHEHLFSLPAPADIAIASKEIFQLPTKSQALSKMFDSEEALERFLSICWEEREAAQFILNGGYKRSLAELCSEMGGDPEENLVRLLTFGLGKDSSLANRQELYIAQEDIRKTLLLALAPDDFEKIFTHYFNNETLINRKVISASVTRRFFEEEQMGKAERLRALAEKHETQLVYRVSLQRQVLLQEGIALNKESLAMLDSKKIGGIDVVGSLREKSYVYPQAEEKIEQHLTELFDYISERSLVLVFHLFEGSNEGPFYSVLEKTLRDYSRPLLLEIGHIAQLNQHWIDVLSSNQNLKVLFHVNVCSNQLLHDCSLTHLQETVACLVHRGMHVVPGCDGRGILPGSSFVEQMRLLNQPLNDKSFLSMAAPRVRPSFLKAFPNVFLPLLAESSIIRKHGQKAQYSNSYQLLQQ